VTSTFEKKKILGNGGDEESQPPQHTDTLPTLLSVVDPDTGAYVHALDNSVYRLVDTAKFVDDNATEEKVHDDFRSDIKQQQNDKQRPAIASIDEYPKLRVDKTHVRYGESITLSWTEGRNSFGHPVVAQVDDDESSVLFVFVCSSDGGNGKPLRSNERQILEVATVSQALATSARNVGAGSGRVGGEEDRKWFISRFPIVRQESCQFALYQPRSPHSSTPASTTELHLLAESEVFHPLSLSTPTAIHLALSSDPTEMVVNFVTGGAEGRATGDGAHAAATGLPVACIVDGNSSQVISTFDGTTDTYKSEDLCQAPANETGPGKFQSPGLLHTVRMKGLAPDTEYHYKVGLKTGQGIALAALCSVNLYSRLSYVLTLRAHALMMTLCILRRFRRDVL